MASRRRCSSASGRPKKPPDPYPPCQLRAVSCEDLLEPTPTIQTRLGSASNFRSQASVANIEAIEEDDLPIARNDEEGLGEVSEDDLQVNEGEAAEEPVKRVSSSRPFLKPSPSESSATPCPETDTLIVHEMKYFDYRQGSLEEVNLSVTPVPDLLVPDNAIFVIAVPVIDDHSSSEMVV